MIVKITIIELIHFYMLGKQKKCDMLLGFKAGILWKNET